MKKWKVVIFSSIALVFIALGFLVNGYLMLVAVLFMLLGQRELRRKT